MPLLTSSHEGGKKEKNVYVGEGGKLHSATLALDKSRENWRL